MSRVRQRKTSKPSSAKKAELSLNAFYAGFPVMITVHVLAMILFCAGFLAAWRTLQDGKSLYFDEQHSLPVAPRSLESVELIPLSRAFFRDFPEFSSPREEAAYWQTAARLYSALTAKTDVSIRYRRDDGSIESRKAFIASVGPRNTFESTWVLLIVVIAYIGFSLVNLRHHTESASRILTIFLLFCAAYFVAAVPLVARPLALDPFKHKLFTKALYTSAAGLLSLGHFACLFPARRGFLQKYPWLLPSWYVFGGIAVFLYAFDFIAFGTTFYAFCSCIFLIFALLVSGAVLEKDVFLRRQAYLVISAPILASVFFIGYLVPSASAKSVVPFGYFALFSLVLPLTLSFALANRNLYNDGIRSTERIREQEREIRHFYHDYAITELDLFRNAPEVKLLSQSLRASLAEIVGNLRIFIQTSNARLQVKTWSALEARMKELGKSIFGPEGFTLEVPDLVSVEQMERSLSESVVRELTLVVSQAMLNVQQHGKAKTFGIFARIEDNALVIRMRDDGQGFNPHEKKEGHYGIIHMQERIRDIGGEASISSNSNGTEWRVRFPLPPSRSK